ncbi:MAG: RNA polymerase sigma-70 factor (ECF subfamily) [Candidatus Paceibacteria bacterium]|jgi:RNA polymerase sigma-70 factor (ECF subfamily)
MPEPTYPNEATLIKGLLDQHDAAYRQVISAHQNSMLQLAKSFVGDRYADEVVQEAWLSVLKSLARFEGRSSLRTWLLRIVANEAKSRLRRENRLTSLDALIAIDPQFADRFDGRGHWQGPVARWQADSPEALLSSEQMQSCLDETVDKLPDLQAATLRLKEQQGLPFADICNILEVNESNCRVLLHRARTRLYKTIEHFQLTGECCTS